MNEVLVLLFSAIAVYELAGGVFFVSVYRRIDKEVKASANTVDKVFVVLPPGFIPQHYFERLGYHSKCFQEDKSIQMPFLGQLVCCGVLSTGTLSMLSAEYGVAAAVVPGLMFAMSIHTFYTARKLVRANMRRTYHVQM